MVLHRGEAQEGWSPRSARAVGVAVVGSSLVASLLVLLMQISWAPAAPQGGGGGVRALGGGGRMEELFGSEEQGVGGARMQHSLFQQHHWAALFAHPGAQAASSGLAGVGPKNPAFAGLHQPASPPPTFLSLAEGSLASSHHLAPASHQHLVLDPEADRAGFDQARAALVSYPQDSVDSRAMELEHGAQPEQRVRRSKKGAKEELSYTSWASSSSFDNPGDFDVHQQYEYIPPPEAAGMTESEGREAWKGQQERYRALLPSSSTSPAVPVIFNNKGQPSGLVPGTDDFDPDMPDVYNAVGHQGKLSARLASSPEGRSVNQESLSQALAQTGPGARTTKLNYAPNAQNSRYSDPADFDIHQVYDYVPGGGGMSDAQGKQLWLKMQERYRQQTPSSSSFPAVPVVFSRAGWPKGYPIPHDPNQLKSAPAPAPSLAARQDRQNSKDEKVEETQKTEITKLREQIQKMKSQEAEAAKAAAKKPLTPLQILHKWERQHLVNDASAYKKHPNQLKKAEIASEGHQLAEQTQEHSAQEDEIKELKQTIEGLKGKMERTEKQTHSLKAQVNEMKRKAAEPTQERREIKNIYSRTALAEHTTQQLKQQLAELQQRTEGSSNMAAAGPQKELAKAKAQLKEEARSKVSMQRKALEFLHAFDKKQGQASVGAEEQTLASSVLQAISPNPQSSSPAAAEQLAQAPKSTAAPIRDSSGSQSSGMESKLDLPEAVKEKAGEIVKKRLTQALAQADEEEDDAETAFIMGPHAHSSEAGSSGKEPFGSLHQIEAGVMRDLDQQYRAKKEAAAKAAQEKKRKEASALKAKKQAEERLKAKKKRQHEVVKKLAAEADKGQGKKMKQQAAVRERALEFVRAFSKISPSAPSRPVSFL